MAHYILALNIDDAFYQEFAAQGAATETLLEQLRFDIEDQIAEYDFQQLIADIRSSQNHKNRVIFVPKKNGESVFSQT